MPKKINLIKLGSYKTLSYIWYMLNETHRKMSPVEKTEVLSKKMTNDQLVEWIKRLADNIKMGAVRVTLEMELISRIGEDNADKLIEA